MSTVVGLTTLESLRRWVLRSDADSSKDDKLTEYGEVFSERVTDYCQRQFAPDPATDDDDPVAHAFGYDGSGILSFTPYELRISDDLEIKLYTDRDASLQQTVPASHYRLLPRGGTRQATYEGLQIGLPTLVPLSYGFDWEVTVTGRWGMVAVPKAVELAVWISVADAMLNPGSMALQQLGGFQVQPEQVDPSFDLDDRGSLPRGAMRALAPYRRRKRSGTIALRRPTPTARTVYGPDLPRL